MDDNGSSYYRCPTKQENVRRESSKDAEDVMCPLDGQLGFEHIEK